MKKVEAIIRHEVLERVRDALDQSGFHGLTVTEVRGAGSQRGYTESYRGAKASIVFRPKVKIEIVASDDSVERVLSVICENAQTGDVGDGKIFVTSVDEVVRIRTQQRGSEAI